MKDINCKCLKKRKSDVRSRCEEALATWKPWRCCSYWIYNICCVCSIHLKNLKWQSCLDPWSWSIKRSSWGLGQFDHLYGFSVL